MFSRILIANRGEIALRVIRACKEMGIETVAVYSEKDRDAIYLRFADETICIGPPASAQSYLDIPLLAKALAGRHVAFVARDSLARNRLLAWIMRRCGTVLIARGRPDAAAVRETVAHLSRGDAIIIFPEGARTRDGALRPFKRGALLAARRAGVPVVPCAVAGSFRAWPSRRRWPRPGRLRVAFAPPVDPRAPDAQESVRAAVEELLAGTAESSTGH